MVGLHLPSEVHVRSAAAVNDTRSIVAAALRFEGERGLLVCVLAKMGQILASVGAVLVVESWLLVLVLSEIRGSVVVTEATCRDVSRLCKVGLANGLR